MRDDLTMEFRQYVLVICLAGILAGCVTVEVPEPSGVTNVPDTPSATGEVGPITSAQTPSEQPSSPPLQLAVRDLAIILDLVDKLESNRPELKRQMLVELSDADDETAAEVVGRWKGILDQHLAEDSGVNGMPLSNDDLAPDNAQILKTMFESPVATDLPINAESHATESLPPQSDRLETTAASHTQDLPPSTSGGVQGKSPSSAVSRTWEEQLEEMIQQARVRSDGEGTGGIRAQAQLKLLEMVRDVARTNHSSEVPDQTLWQRLAPVLALCVKPPPFDQESVDIALLSIHSLAQQLCGPQALVVRNMTFCSRVERYGVLTEMSSLEFHPGQQLGLYAEIENFESQRATGCYRTKLQTRVELYDLESREVWKHDFSPVEDECRRLRRDYYISHVFQLPRDLPPGTYRLRLTVDDFVSSQTASEELGFTVQ